MSSTSVRRALLIVALAWSVMPRLTAQDAAGIARQAYQTAMRENDSQRRLDGLRRSFEAMPTFEASIAAAETLLATRTDALEARRWAERAYGLSQRGSPMARALFRLAETYAAANQQPEYKVLLKRSMDEYPTPLAEKALLEASRPTLLKAPDIARSLRAPNEEGLRDLELESSVDLAVNFEFDSAVVDPSGQEQLRELANALKLVRATDANSAQRVLVIGHTDTQGDPDYNLGLSRRRAEAVKALLVSRYSYAADAIETDGHGMREPLVRGNSPEHHAVNRRVEVRLVP